MKALKLAALVALAAPAFAQTPAPPPTLTPLPAGNLAQFKVSGGQRLVTYDLTKDFPEAKGLIYTQTRWVIPPGAGREMHSHKDDLELQHVVSGTLTVQRQGQPPVSYPAGSTVINDTATVHMWANLGKEPLVILNTNVRKGEAR